MHSSKEGERIDLIKEFFVGVLVGSLVKSNVWFTVLYKGFLIAD